MEQRPNKDYTHQIIDIGWKQLGEQPSNLYPYAKLRSLLDDSISDLLLDSKYDFNWELSSERFCVGYFEESQYIPCPYKNSSSHNYGQCAHCSKKIGFMDAFFLGKGINERMKKHLSKPHVIYLAYFQPDLIKVGTAVEYRKYVRTMEQDALFAAVVARADGFSIQGIERAISKLGYPEGVSSRRKRKYFSSTPTLEKSTSILYNNWQSIRDKLEESEHFHSLFEFHDRISFLNSIISHVNNSNLFTPPIEKKVNYQQEIEHLTGEFRGLRAKYLIWENSEKLYGISKSRILGRYILHQPNAKTYSQIDPPTLF